MGIRLPEVTSCCCCVALKTGALILGYTSGVISLIGVGIYIALIVSVSRTGSDAALDPAGVEPDASNDTITYVTLGFQCFGYVNNFILSALLVVGSHKGKPLLLRMSWHGMFMNLIFNVIIAVVVAVINDFYINLGQLFWWAIAFYLVLVVRSLHIQILRHKLEVTPRK